MPGFARDHLRPLIGSAGLHLLLLVMLAGFALRWTSNPPPVQLAIEGTVVDARDLPRSLRTGKPFAEPPAKSPPKAEPRPEPAPQPPPRPVEDTQASERAAAAAAQAAAAQIAAEKQAAEQRKEAADRKRRADQAAAESKAAAEDARRRADAEARAQEAAKEQAARDAKVKADREARLKRELAAEEEGAAIAQSGVMDEYRAVLIQAIERNWIRPPSARAGLECTLNVTQATGGTVIDVQVGTCNGDQAVRESITNAVYRSSPLPAPRDPRAFERRLVIVFKPKE